MFFPFDDNLYKRPRDLYFLRVVARLKPGVTTAQAQSEMDRVSAQMRGAFTEFATAGVKRDPRIVEMDVISEENRYRHDPSKLAAAIMRLYHNRGQVVVEDPQPAARP